MMFCTKCKKGNKEGSVFCGYCGNPFAGEIEKLAEVENPTKEDIDIAYYKANLLMQQQALKVQQQELEEAQKQAEHQRKQYELEKEKYNNMSKCPMCGSISLTPNKKGYDIFKGIIGAAVLGKAGLLAGIIGSKKIKITCVKCGHVFEKGE